MNLCIELLKYKNIISIRIKGLYLLLKLIDILTIKCEHTLINLFICNIQWNLFDEQNIILYNWLQIKNINFIGTGFLFALNTNHINKIELINENIKLFDYILSFTLSTARKKTYHYWIDLIHQHFFPILYPVICNKVGYYNDENNTIGYRPICPHSLHIIVIAWCIKCISIPQYLDAICNNEIYMKIWMEIFRQSNILFIKYIQYEIYTNIISFYYFLIEICIYMFYFFFFIFFVVSFFITITILFKYL
jgi:hypothetical protein